MIMAVELQITVRDMPHSEALDERIRRKVAALQRLDRRIVACKVVVEALHHHQQWGSHFQVRVDVVLPHGVIVASRDHTQDVYVALRDTFLAARRQLVARHGRAEGGLRRNHRVARPND